MIVVKEGDRGYIVRRIQRVLAGLGLYPAEWIDGDFGPVTQKAVMKFQRKTRLKVDGIVGPITYGMLFDGELVKVGDVVELALSQDGDEYIFGAEASPDDADPKAFDCSELVQWVCDRLGVKPQMPDGAIWQWRHCRKHGTLIEVAEALETRGALLLRVNHPRYGNHVAISLGDGWTIEARDRRSGVGRFPSYGRPWTHGALIPGVDYS
jgi:peptidoglycan hydrolase-like protein with peptidoglycan-binding domain